MGGGISKHQDELDLDGNKPSLKDSATSSNAPQQPVPSPNSQHQDESKCPMHNSDGSYSFDWTQLFRAASIHGPKGSKPLSIEEQGSSMNSSSSDTNRNGEVDNASVGDFPNKYDAVPKFPVVHDKNGSHHLQQHSEYDVYSQPIDKNNQMPKGVRTQIPNPYQTKELSTERISSSIPKGGDTSSSTWTYPSPQQFYNALSRKGKLNPYQQAEEASEEDMASVVALHNNMNEKTWAKIVEWERQTFAESATPKLLKFAGRPHDLSPKARLKHYLLGHPLPYDRHDWTVLREDGTTVRYVIDYYYDESRAKETEQSSMPELHDRNGTPSLLVDVRPALDGPAQLLARTVLMPYKILTHQTNYEPLPLRGTPEMANQVQESIQVWKSIQQLRKSEEHNEQAEEEIEDVSGIINESIQISDEQARDIARNFALAMRDCQNARMRMEKCTTEHECSRASMDLTMCMGERLCPLQHASLVKALSMDDVDDQEVEASLETLTECVMLKTAERRVAREQHPDLFRH